MRKLLLLFLLLLGLGLSAAQAQNADPAVLDSLQRRLAAAPPNDTLRVYLLDELCWNLSRADLPRAKRYAEEGIELARRLNYLRGEARCHNDLGTCLTFAGDAAGGLRHHLAALHLFEELGMRKAMSYAYNGIANSHNLQRRYDTAEKYYLRGLHLARQRHDLADQALFLGNLADMTLRRGQATRADRYAHQALRLYGATNQVPGLADCLFTLGSIQTELHRYDSARHNITEAQTLYRVLGDQYGLAGTYTTLSEVLLAQQQPKLAIEYARLGLRYARQVGSAERMQYAYQQLADDYAQLGHYQQAYTMQQSEKLMRDSLLNDVQTRVMAALQTRYEAFERDNHIRLLTQRQKVTEMRAARDEAHVRLLAVVVGGLLLLVVLGGLLYGKVLRSRRELAVQHALVAGKNDELEEAAVRLRQLAESKARLYAVIAHDLRGPVTALAGVTNLISFYQRTNDQESLRHLPDMVHESAQSLNGLLDNLLNWAASQTGELRCQPERLVARDLLSACYELFQTTAHSNQIQLRYEAAPDLLLYADPNMVSTILRNLVSNALKFTPAGGTVTLSAEPDTTDPTQVRLMVTDTGPGLPVDQLHRVLHPEEQHLRATDPVRSTQGTGLGLQLCHTFTECHGGSLGMATGPQGGAMVWATLPSGGSSLRKNTATLPTLRKLDETSTAA